MRPCLRLLMVQPQMQVRLLLQVQAQVLLARQTTRQAVPRSIATQLCGHHEQAQHHPYIMRHSTHSINSSSHNSSSRTLGP